MLPLRAFFLALGLPVVVYAELVYFHDSCTNRPGWSDFYAESNAMIESANRRLRSGTDTVFRAVVQQLFKLTPADTEGWNRLIEVMDELEGWLETDELEKSKVRMYCDNDSRVKLNDPEGTVGRWEEDYQYQDDGNIKLDSEGNPLMTWVDFENGMEITPDEDWAEHHRRPGCPEDVTQQVYGVTYRHSIEAHDHQMSGRRTITICDFTFNPSINHPRLGKLHAKLIDIDPNILNGADAEYLSLLVSLTITHERVHASFDNIDDIEPGAYNWVNIVQKDTTTALLNADNYAYLALYARLADLGWKLKRPSDYPEGTDPATIENDLNHGILAGYIDVTARSIKGRLAKLFRA